MNDVDRASRAGASIHLVEQAVANRNFIRRALADVINDGAPAQDSDLWLTIFSPFGLGILDPTVSKQSYKKRN